MDFMQMVHIPVWVLLQSVVTSQGNTHSDTINKYQDYCEAQFVTYIEIENRLF